jgi:glycine dehydrogenase
LDVLEQHGDFIGRHIGPDGNEIGEMLAELGLASLDALIEKCVPTGIQRPMGELPIPPKNERLTIGALRDLRERNRVFVSMIGMGYYGTVMPSVIKRNVLENPGWYTAYTPYQAEVSQGRLEALLNFQQMVIDMTGMEIANASLLDEATAAAEAMTMARRVGKHPGNLFFIDRDCHPQTIAVVQTRAEPLGIEIAIGDPLSEFDASRAFAILVQYPGSSGQLVDLRPIAERAHRHQGLLCVATDLLALSLVTPPGELDADIVLGSSQRFGVPMGYGGPHAAFFATRDAFKRSMPGRIIGVSVDRQGRPALRMALQTREQHIRREKATSNICTAEVLPALLAAFYAVYHGPERLRMIAARVHRMTCVMAEGLKQLGFEIETTAYFDTVTVHVPGQAQRIAARARESGINLRVVDADRLGIAFDETTQRHDLLSLWKVFSTRAGQRLKIEDIDRTVLSTIPNSLRRTRPFLMHPVFNRYHSETEMCRYVRRLAARDIALDRAMIPLGSCTMKLNATTEMLALSYRQFAMMHPFAPLDQAQGYLQLFEELEEMLCAITGFDAFSLQPNAGSQGEFAGLLVIRKYHATRGEAHRDVCLIPASAHGTNPASAAMAGLQVVVVACDESGNVDVADLTAKAAEHAERLAALMITYPSTHGVFEEAIIDICDIVHRHGGQVYMDGANLNALVGLCQPALIGADVSHINLHKTFAIPHGGGGPGMGPIGVKSHLAQFLPDHPVVAGVNPAAAGRATIGTVSAAPWGSASVLAISWAYILMMGADGLRRATQVAILNANYIAARLAPHYPILYTGKGGMVAHECIIDLRHIKASCGITVDDVAKRLVDYGFHAPTMSFPVPDTLMIEPTESEGKQEIDRFCNAMIAIRQEIAEVETGEADRENNLLRNAPHPHSLLVSDTWDFAYSKERAYFPLRVQQVDKFWPPVGRVDNLQGDRHLVCTCPPLADYQ